MKGRRLSVIPLIAFPMLAFVCSQPHAPAIRNTLDHPVVVSVQYRKVNSLSYEEISISPGAKAWAPPDAIAVDEIEVRSGGDLLFKLGKDELEQLISGFPPAARVMWEIREDGVVPTNIPDPSR